MQLRFQYGSNSKFKSFVGPGIRRCSSIAERVGLFLTASDILSLSNLDIVLLSHSGLISVPRACQLCENTPWVGHQPIRYRYIQMTRRLESLIKLTEGENPGRHKHQCMVTNKNIKHKLFEQSLSTQKFTHVEAGLLRWPPSSAEERGKPGWINTSDLADASERVSANSEARNTLKTELSHRQP